MFNPFDRANHADLLRGMTRRSLGGPDSAPPSLLASQQSLQAYLAQPFAPPKPGSPDAGLFSAAVLFAQKDPTVKAYFAKLQAALKHKIASLKQKGFAETDQAALDKLPNRIAVAQDAVDKSKKYLLPAALEADKAFVNFVTWVEDSMTSALLAENRIPGKLTFTDAQRKDNGAKINAWLYAQDKAVRQMLGQGSGALKTPGPALKQIPTDSLVFDAIPYEGTAMLVGSVPKMAGVVFVDGKPYWKSALYAVQYAPIADQPTTLRYVGTYAEKEPETQGWFAQSRWNNDFLPKLATATKLYQQFVGNTNILRDLLVSRDTLTKSVADENAAAQAEQAAYEQGLADANAIKSKLSGFLLGYAQALGEQYTKAAELNGLTAAREAMQAQNAKWFAEYDAMTKQGNALLAQADTETDEGRKAALRIEAGRRLGRALEMNARGQSLRDGALKRYGDRRSGAVKDLADAQAKSQLSLPTVVLAQVQTDTAKIAELTAQIAAIQAAADATKQEIIDGLNKLPEGFKPPNAPPPPAAKAKGGAGWILALGAAGAAFIAYKRGH